MPWDERDRHDAVRLIGDDLVALHKRYYGKGPDSVRTLYGEDAITVILRGGQTPIERALIASGRPETVHAIRGAFQHVVQHEMRTIVERATDREVTAFLSAHSGAQAVQTETFLLAPADGCDPVAR
jgi:uncharacterized protein YbcI